MSLHDNIFKRIQEQANIHPDDIYSIANSLKSANFSDEMTVRNLVKKLSQLAQKPISQEKEDKIVEAITKNQFPSSLDSLNNSFYDE